jgi:hypothetical protein
MNNTVYGIHNNNEVMFLTLEAAEDYLINEYPEYCFCKNATYDFCENMIWEETKEYLMREIKQ